MYLKIKTILHRGTLYDISLNMPRTMALSMLFKNTITFGWSIRIKTYVRSGAHNLSSRVLDFVDHLCYFCIVSARLFIDALWLPAWEGLTSWLSFVMSNFEVVTFPLVAWVRCGA